MRALQGHSSRRAALVGVLTLCGGGLLAQRLGEPPLIVAEPARAAPPPAASAALDDAAKGRLGVAVQQLGAWCRERGGRAVVALVDVDSGASLASLDADTPVNPASTSKLVTAAAALSRLGPAYRWRTSVLGRIEGGVASRLVLRGHGDPTLAVEHLVLFAAQLRARGLVRVSGDLLVDQSRFDDQFVPPAFEQQPDEWAAFRAPVAAVSLERNAVTLLVQPGRAGEPARHWFEPPGVLRSSGAIDTTEPGTGQRLQFSVRAEGTELSGLVGGSIAEGSPVARFARRVEDPRLLAGRALAQALASEGIKLGGRVALGGADERAVLAVHESPPLPVVLAALGKESDNFTAEMVLKTLGAEAQGRAGTSAEGAQVALEYLKGIGALSPGTKFINGSGLFDANRLSASTLTRLLSAALRDPALAPEFEGQLAVAGVDGTLRARFRQHRAERDLRAKTGTLARTVALAGYLHGGPPARRRAAFAVVVSGITEHGPVRQKVDALIEALALELRGASP